LVGHSAEKLPQVARAKKRFLRAGASTKAGLVVAGVNRYVGA
jgi:hypothetical protein